VTGPRARLSFTADAIGARLREASRLAGSLRPEDRLQTKVDLSGLAVTSRLREASQSLELCRELGRVDPRLTDDMTAHSASGRFSTQADAAIRRAITERRLLRFWLDGGARVAEPHDYGVRKGKVQLLVYQLNGASRSGRLPDWRWVDLSRATDFEVLEQEFAGPRQASSGRHAGWEQVLLRVASRVP